MTLLCRRGQSTGEYAVLFAIVLGAVIAVQNAVRNRVASRILDQADTYATTGGATYTAPAMTRQSDSVAAQRATMTNAKTGTLRSDSEGTQIVTNPE